MPEWGFYYTSRREVVYWVWIIKRSPLVQCTIPKDIVLYVVSHLTHEIAFNVPPWCLYPTGASPAEAQHVRHMRNTVIEWMSHKGRHIVQFGVLYIDLISVLLTVLYWIPSGLNVLILAKNKSTFNLISERFEKLYHPRARSLRLRSMWKFICIPDVDFVFAVNFELTRQQCKVFSHCHLMSIIK